MRNSLLYILFFIPSCIPVPDFSEREEVIINKTHGNINVKYIRCYGSAPDQNYKTFVSISDGKNQDTILWYRKVNAIDIHSDTVFIKVEENNIDAKLVIF